VVERLVAEFGSLPPSTKSFVGEQHFLFLRFGKRIPEQMAPAVGPCTHRRRVDSSEDWSATWLLQ
jgi:hypothetical protein